MRPLARPLRTGGRGASSTALFASLGASVVVHAVGFLVAGPFLVISETLPAEVDMREPVQSASPSIEVVEEEQPESEELVQLDDAKIQPKPTPQLPLPVEPVEIDQPKPEDEEEKKEPEKKAQKLRDKKIVATDGDLMVDIPETGKESEPPPDTRVLSRENRRVEREEMPTKRALKPSDSAAESLLNKPAAFDEEQDRDETMTRRKKVEPNKGEQKEEPADRESPPDAPQPPTDKVEAREAKDKGARGAPGKPAPEARAEKTKPTELEEPGDGLAPAPTPDKPDPSPDEPGDDGDHGDNVEVDVEAALAIDGNQYRKVFGERDAADAKRIRDKPRNFLGKHETRARQMRAALENFAPNVRPGNQILMNTRRSVYAAWVAAIHRKVHYQWAFRYLRLLDLQYPMGHPLSDPSLGATIEFIVDGESGEVVGCGIVRSSGQLEYDAEAIRICYDTGPHTKAPSAIVSPDGRVYLHWNFWRNTRQCGTFGVSLYVLNEEGMVDEHKVDEQIDDLNKHFPNGASPEHDH